ncbi:hypothetical protein SS05631_c31940 [Sinorhizobium sp. CCBAU 05631]|nr:hypothetical protein SS05631_c31940 [Sinorhizobium sp. CCBAU 05631]
MAPRARNDSARIEPAATMGELSFAWAASVKAAGRLKSI